MVMPYTTTGKKNYLPLSKVVYLLSACTKGRSGKGLLAKGMFAQGFDSKPIRV